MPVTITNLTNRSLYLTLTSGVTQPLGPRATSPELADVEVADNAMLDKLASQFVIAISATASADAPAAGESGEQKPSRKRRENMIS